MLLLRFRKESTPSFRFLVHAADIVWPVIVILFATQQGGPFLLFFVFVLGASAYRWGLWETFGTAIAIDVLLWAESFAIRHGASDWLDQMVVHHRLPSLAVETSQFQPKHLFMLSAYLLVMGLLLGYLAEQQKRLRAERAIIARVLGRVRVEAGLTGTLQAILGELLTMYSAPRALIASQETNKYKVFVGDLQAMDRVFRSYAGWSRRLQRIGRRICMKPMRCFAGVPQGEHHQILLAESGRVCVHLPRKRWRP